MGAAWASGASRSRWTRRLRGQANRPRLRRLGGVRVRDHPRDDGGRARVGESEGPYGGMPKALDENKTKLVWMLKTPTGSDTIQRHGTRAPTRKRRSRTSRVTLERAITANEDRDTAVR